MSKPTILLIHGAFGDASSWRPVFDLLDGDEYTVVAPPSPLHGVAADASYTAAVIDQLEGPDAPSAARRVDVRHPWKGRRAEVLDVAAVPGAAARADHRGHPLRDEVVEVRHLLDWRLARHTPRRRRDERRVRPHVLRRRHSTNLPLEDVRGGKAWVA